MDRVEHIHTLAQLGGRASVVHLGQDVAHQPLAVVSLERCDDARITGLVARGRVRRREEYLDVRQLDVRVGTAVVHEQQDVSAL